MSTSDSQEILNRITTLLNEFIGIEIQGFDISEEKRIYIESVSVLFDQYFKDGIAVKYDLYLDEPVYILALVSKNAFYEIAARMKIETDADFEKVRDDENALSFITELINLMTASVADNYARRLSKRVIYSPPKIIKHIFSPEIIKGIGIRSRPAKIIVYEFIFSEPESAIKMLLI
ncbi:MAG: hypothetical protein N3B13_05675, partial [Deltaproteobacteria bacterium]|nr:hypothetical protein [Deltaproteobacteria bacterium]